MDLVKKYDEQFYENDYETELRIVSTIPAEPPHTCQSERKQNRDEVFETPKITSFFTVKKNLQKRSRDVTFVTPKVVKKSRTTVKKFALGLPVRSTKQVDICSYYLKLPDVHTI